MRYVDDIVFCEACEERTAVRSIHEPYDDGMLWVRVGCKCGFRRIIRDDWHPENVGITHTPHDSAVQNPDSTTDPSHE